MKGTYIELGISPGGALLVLRPAVRYKLIPVYIMLRDLAAKGWTAGADQVGQMLISALGAFQPDVDHYRLLPAALAFIRFPTDPPPNDPPGEMRDLRMGIGLEVAAAVPHLLLQAFDCNEPIGQGQPHSLEQLAELEQGAATTFIGEIMLRQLAAMHPDVSTLLA